MNPDKFQLITPYKSYVSKAEVTALDPRYLVKGSKNVYVDYAMRIISRPGYTLYGAAKTVSTGMKGSYEWQSSTRHEYALRSYAGSLEFDIDNTGIWRTLLTTLRNPYLEFAKVWDDVEKIDMLMFVLGEKSNRRWSGGFTTIASRPSPTTAVKQGIMLSRTTIAFVSGTSTVKPQITDSANGFITAGFAVGQTLYVDGSAANSRNFTIATVAAGLLELVIDDIVVDEAAGTSITLHTGEPTWSSSRFRATGTRSFLYNGLEYTYSGGEATDTLTGITAVVGEDLGVFTVTLASPGVFTRVAHGLVSGDAVKFETTGVLPTGLTPGTTYYVIATGLTADDFEVSATIGGSAIDTSVTQSGVHTLFKLSFPSTVSAGNAVWQTVDTLPNPGDIDTVFAQDLIGVELNQLILASKVNRQVYGSSTSDYTDYALTSPRAPGDPFKITIDENATCIIPIDNPDAAQTSTMFGAGRGEFFQLSFKLSQDNANELARVIKLATAESSGPISSSAVAPIKKSTVYISNEPALDTLARVENSDSNDLPISDPIKDDFDVYNFTGAHIRYWKRAIYIALPAEGVVLIYDLMRNLWQPPWTMPIARLAVIGGWLYGHSSIGNETYKLWDGTNDNGNFIPQVARFAYNNGGRRDRLKNMNEYWSDGYITPNAELDYNLGFGFIGNNALREFSISGSDEDVVIDTDASHMGSEEVGSLDGLDADDIIPSSLAGMNRFYQADTVDLNDYTEMYTEYVMNTKDGRFALVAHGNNQWDAGTAPVSHKK